MKIIKNIVEIYSENIQILIITIILIILCILLKIYYPKFRGFMGEFFNTSNISPFVIFSQLQTISP